MSGVCFIWKGDDLKYCLIAFWGTEAPPRHNSKQIQDLKQEWQQEKPSGDAVGQLLTLSTGSRSTKVKGQEIN